MVFFMAATVSKTAQKISCACAKSWRTASQSASPISIPPQQAGKRSAETAVIADLRGTELQKQSTFRINFDLSNASPSPDAAFRAYATQAITHYNESDPLGYHRQGIHTDAACHTPYEPSCGRGNGGRPESCIRLQP